MIMEKSLAKIDKILYKNNTYLIKKLYILDLIVRLGIIWMNNKIIVC